MFYLGDKVVLRKHPNKVTGKIVFAKFPADGDYSYQVRYDNQDLIPPEGWHPGEALERISEEFKTVACECGVDMLGYGKHSDYCPKHFNEVRV